MSIAADQKIAHQLERKFSNQMKDYAVTTTPLVDRLMKLAETEDDVGDAYVKNGDLESARYHHGQALAYRRSAKMVRDESKDTSR